MSDQTKGTGAGPVRRDPLDNYFDRQAALQIARSHVCPACGAAAGTRCTDRYGLATSMVHNGRHQGAYIDPYGMGDDEATAG